MTPAARWDDEIMNMDGNHWLAYGIEQGFCGPPVCTTHDGIPSTREEDEVWEEFGEGGGQTPPPPQQKLSTNKANVS